VIVADACWVIALRDPRDRHHAAAIAVNVAIGDDDVLLNPVTFAECLVAPARLGTLDEAANGLRAACEITTVDEEAPMRWAQLRATTGLRLPDVIVLDTAATHTAEAIATFDDRLRRIAAVQGIATRPAESA
jgi:predicted nucleic acid-binding protein